MWNSKQQIWDDLKAIVQIVKWLWLPWFIVTLLLFVSRWANPSADLLIYFVISGAMLLILSKPIGILWREFGIGSKKFWNELLHLDEDFPSVWIWSQRAMIGFTMGVGATLLIYGIVRLMV